MIIGIGVVTTSTLVLYNISYKRMSERVETMSINFARRIDAAANFDNLYLEQSKPGDARAATLLQVRQAHLNSFGFGMTGEYVLGELKGDRIEFLLPTRKAGNIPAAMSRNSQSAAPMRQALLGMAGVMLAPDYLGKTVIAGYQPLPSLNAGLVAKIDLEEIRAPYLKVFYFGLIFVFIFSVLGSLAYGAIVAAKSWQNTTRQQILGMIVFLICFLLVAGGTTAIIIGKLYTQSIK
jgi:hypothetical protein